MFAVHPDFSRTLWRVFLGVLIVVLFFSTLVPAQASAPVPTRDESAPAQEQEIEGQDEEGSSYPVYRQTSAFLAGRVAVGVVAIESSTSSIPNQENWTSDELEKVRDEVWAGLQKWVAWKPANTPLEFVVDITRDGRADDMTSESIRPVQINDEPIVYASGTYDIWTRAAMVAMGYTGSTVQDAAYQYANVLRTNNNADWAFVLFVVDSSNDNDTTPGAFTDGQYMITRTFDPLAVMTYNNGTRGADNMKWTVAQIVARVFGAGFQYPDPLFDTVGCGSATKKFGYLGVANSYCGVALPGGEPNPRLMYHGNGDPDSITKLQVGWRDTDANGLIDLLDVPPSIVFSPYPENPTLTKSLTYAEIGSRQYRAYQNPVASAVCAPRFSDECFYSFYYDITPDNLSLTINKIQTVEYRIDSGSWVGTTLSGTSPDYKIYSFTTPILDGGRRRVEVRAQNSQGLYSLSSSELVTIADPPINDLFINRITIDALSYNHAVDTFSIPVEFEIDPTDPLPFSPTCQNTRKGKRSVWYEYEAISNQTIYVGTLGTDYTTVVSVWIDEDQNGSIQNDELIACGDGRDGSQPVVSFSAEAGTKYYFMISEFNTELTSLHEQDNVLGQGGGTLVLYVNTLPSSFQKLTPSDTLTAQSKSPVLRWEDSNGAISYEYCYSSAPGPCARWNSVGNRTYVTLKGLMPGYTYYWQVRAVNLAGSTQADSGVWWSFSTENTPRCSWPSYTPPVSSTFSDVPSSVSYWSFVERLFSSGITSGCTLGKFCPFDDVKRAQMAIFLLRGMYCGMAYTPPPVGSSTGFSDVPLTAFYAPWVKQLAVEGITSGCEIGLFCPFENINRAQMAIFLLRARHGATYSPPAIIDNSGFNDVPSTVFYAPWVKQLALEGITLGCGDGNFCPYAPVTRAQMAIFLVRTFGLP